MTIKSKFGLPIIVAAVLVLMQLLPIVDHTVIAQPSKKSLAVDVVGLTGGRKVHGIVISHETATKLEMLVERRWLEDNHPKLHKQAVAAEKQSAATTRETLLHRLDQWIAERIDGKNDGQNEEQIIGQNGDELLVDFLTDERDRIASEKIDPPPNRLFVRMELNNNEVRNVYRQARMRQNVAGLAWQHGLEQVSTSSLKALQKKLTEKNVDSNTARFNLAEEVPVTIDSPRTWAARQALVEIRYREALEFQGTTDQLVRFEEKPHIAQLLSGMLGGVNQISRLGEALGLPDFKNNELKIEKRKWWKPATDVAEKEGFKGVLISRLLPTLADVVTVEISVFAKMPDGNWEPVVQRYGKSKLSDVQLEDMERVQNDPQIEQVMQTLKQLDLDSGSELLKKAIRLGAATESALKQAQGDFGSCSLDSTRNINSQILFR